MKAILILISILLSVPVLAQHEHHGMQMKQPQKAVVPKRATPVKKQAAPAKKEAAPEEKQAAPEHQHHMAQPSQHIADTLHTSEHTEGKTHEHDEMAMNHAFSLNLPMNRNGSGTSWLPDTSAMYGYMKHSGKWMFMFHGNVFIRYNKQDLGDKGSRGDSKIDAPNMVMAMGQRRVGSKGLFHFSSMFSLDAAIAGGSGYPLLFQSGETWEGRPLVDRQHPHDLFSELSVSYAHAFSQKMDAFLYLGYPGEPALGPVTFMHRPSGMFNPDAPLSHHWVDATHISFGVATLGLRYGKFKIEGSSFTGREPDENRYDLDKPRFDSWSGRLSFNPSKNWALQVSHGFLKNPETLHPEDVNRTTASATYSKRLRPDVLFDATALWGQNKVQHEGASNAVLLEATLRLKKLALYSRYEWVQKSTEELVLDENIYGHHTVYPVNALTLGGAYDVLEVYKTRMALGAQLTMYSADSRLDGLYGKQPLAGEVYLHVYPSLMR